MSDMEVGVIPLSAVEVGVRFREDMGDLDSLVESFKREGIIQPLAVLRTGNTFKLLAGGRRFAAALKAGYTDIPVRIYNKELNPLEMRSIELMENVVRKDLTWLEAAKLKKEIHELQVAIHGEKTMATLDRGGWSLRDTAALLGRNPGGVSAEINLATAVEAFPQLQDAKDKSEATKMLDRLKEELIRKELAKRIIDKQGSTPAEQLHQQIVSRYIVEDFFEGVKRLPNNSIDFCEIDPPYAIDLQHIKKDFAGMHSTDDYNEVLASDYAVFMDKVIKECKRVMTEDSWLILWFAIEPWIEVLYTIIKDNGLDTNRLPALWYKGAAGQTMQPDRYLASCYEPFFYVRKGKPVIIRAGRSNVFQYKPVLASKKIHPTERPIELTQDILHTFCWEGSRVLVPFLGSGNTILSAANLGLTAFGFDLTAAYKDAFAIRVTENRPPNYRSYKEEV